jgi:hypothetical protein
MPSKSLMTIGTRGTVRRKDRRPLRRVRMRWMTALSSPFSFSARDRGVDSSSAARAVADQVGPGGRVEM